MPADANQQTLTEAVAVFDDADALQAAIDELLSAGFNQAELSLVASDRAVEQKLGHAYRKVEEIEDDPAVPRVAYVSTESRGDAEGALVGGLMYVGALAAVGAVVATGGAVTTAIAAAVLTGGTGGLIGGVFAELIGQSHALRIEEQLGHGGLLLWVRTRDREHETRALDILKRHSAHDVHLHRIASQAA